MKTNEYRDLIRLLEKLGEKIEVEPEESSPIMSNRDTIRDFYLPRVPRGFYYDGKVFRRLLGIE